MVVAAEKTMNAVDRIARYAASARFEGLDALTLERARQTVLDTIGTTFGGYQTDLGRRAAAYAATVEPGDEASIIADGRRSTVAGAAWANGVMSKHLGMDDSHRTAGHVAAEVVPIMFALGEQRRLTGRAVVTAMNVGYEVSNAIQPHVRRFQRERGLDQKGQSGTLMSAVVAAMLMGLDEAGIANALALAMDMASGTEQYVYDSGLCDTKDLLAGYAARNGIYAATLAEFGFRGPPGALDGPYGYFNALGDGYDPSHLDGLGTSRALALNGFKPHAGCRHVHAGVDAAQAILAQGRPALDQIASIDIGSYKGAVTPDFRADLQPQTLSIAGFSLPTAVAVTLVRGGWYREDIEHFADADVRRLLAVTTVGLDEAIEADYPAKNGCVVRLTMRDGRVLEGRVEYAKGEAENMLSAEEFEAKFRRLVGDALSSDAIARILATCAEFETLDDIGDLVRLAAPTRAGAGAPS